MQGHLHLDAKSYVAAKHSFTQAIAEDRAVVGYWLHRCVQRGEGRDRAHATVTHVWALSATGRWPTSTWRSGRRHCRTWTER